MDEYQGKKIVERTDGAFRCEGDDFWYKSVVGGEPVPLFNVGPGPHPDPRVIGPPGMRYNSDRSSEPGTREFVKASEELKRLITDLTPGDNRYKTIKNLRQ